MKASLNWIRFLNDKYHCAAEPAPGGVDELVDKIGLQLGAVEQVINLGERYEGIVVVKVISSEKHPGADKLSVCMVDAGKPEPVQVVCGAPNVKAGMLAAWIPPGVTVPSTFDKQPFVIEKRDIRGVTSNGMLASVKELALGDDHQGILAIDAPAEPGQPFADVYQLDDYIIDIENKMFTHRPDLFGQLGIAREIAGIQGNSFKSPAWYREDADVPADGRNSSLKLAVKNQVPKLVPRFCALAIKDVKVGPSPVWLQVRLSSVGIRPINNIVDITNFLMMETAQPLHAYDYDKVKTGVLGSRLSKKGEKLKLLGGKEIKLDEAAVVITDGEKPIGLGGIMGGAGTEVDEQTKNIILECANFDMNQTRKTAMRYGLFTDAATRFTKNQNPRQNLAVIAKAADDVLKIAGGRLGGGLVDDKHFKDIKVTVETTTDFIASRLGEDLSTPQIKKLLENVEFKAETRGSKLAITAPFWRTDIEIPEDIVEEVGRLYGYDKLPVVLPKRDLAPAPKDPSLEFKGRLREIMRLAGANEALTYSFVNQKLLLAAGQDPKEAYHIRNAVSPDLQYYRMSLSPSLLEKVHPNQKNGYDRFILFEIGKAHIKGVLDEEKLPAELESLAAVIVNPYATGAPYYAARNLADNLFSELHIGDVLYQPLKAADIKRPSCWLNCFEPSRTALAWAGKKPLGLVGEPSQKLRAALKLPAAASMFELDFAALYESQRTMTYQPINRFPSSTQDICLRIPAATAYAEADRFVWNRLEQQAGQKGYVYEVSTIDIFQKPQDKAHRQITWRLELAHPERTLTTDEVNKVLDNLAAHAKKEMNAERI